MSTSMHRFAGSYGVCTDPDLLDEDGRYICGNCRTQVPGEDWPLLRYCDQCRTQVCPDCSDGHGTAILDASIVGDDMEDLDLIRCPNGNVVRCGGCTELHFIKDMGAWYSPSTLGYPLWYNKYLYHDALQSFCSTCVFDYMFKACEETEKQVRLGLLLGLHARAGQDSAVLRASQQSHFDTNVLAEVLQMVDGKGRYAYTGKVLKRQKLE